ncbi:hypothetical protein [Photobacterium galatheae]|uniref:Integrin n=1 Tax=Photobacterium galatheae TaxID=1654360 RepID=A0A066RK32_9GAMM|nr:hypothetical protein [Photobacterium galatheae]KDM90795.1 hypothetical protein EA58_15530 [Photobacterium galatheae]MCM0149876.1 hypothetical protein [Photobacterium galatheae]
MRSKHNGLKVWGISVVALFGIAACGGGDGEKGNPPAAFNLTEVTVEQEGSGRVSFAWLPSERAERYQICIEAQRQCTAIGETTGHERILTLQNSKALTQPQYFIRAINSDGYTDSNLMALPVAALTKASKVFLPATDQQKSVFASNVSMSADGNTIAVAAPFDNISDSFFEQKAGAVYIYQRDEAGFWKDPVQIVASNRDGYDWFGIGISLSDDGKTLAVGASGEQSTFVDRPTENMNDAVGAVYIFESNGDGNWQETAYIKSASSLDLWDHFGGQVELSGNGKTLAVAAIGHDAATTDDPLDNSRIDTGGVYVFERQSNGTWTEKQYLKAAGLEREAGYGYTMAMDGAGTQLVVGMPYSGGTDRYGEVFTYSKDADGHWQLEAILNGERKPVAKFGSEIDMDSRGETLAIAMPGRHGFATGVVRVYTRTSSSNWTFSAEIADPKQDKYSDFGQRGLSVSQDGQVIAIGAMATDVADPDNPGVQITKAGAVYIYRLDEQQNWQQSGIFHARESQGHAYFGHAIDLSQDGSAVAIGSSGLKLRNPQGTGTDNDLNSSVAIY